MPKYRLEYAKLEMARYLSHLELLRIFHRAFRRANLPLAMSEGFNPHQRLSFGPPLGVGVAGRSEYLDLSLEETVPVRTTLEAIFKQLPTGLVARELLTLPPSASGLGKVIDCARYMVEIRRDQAENVDWQSLIEELTGDPEPWIYTRAKDGKSFDVKIGVQAARVTPVDDGTVLLLLLCIGSGEIPVRRVVDLLLDKAGLGEVDLHPEITRTGLFHKQDDQLIDPLGGARELWEE